MIINFLERTNCDSVKYDSDSRYPSDAEDYEATIHELLGTSGGPVFHEEDIVFPHFHGNPQLKR